MIKKAQIFQINLVQDLMMIILINLYKNILSLIMITHLALKFKIFIQIKNLLNIMHLKYNYNRIFNILFWEREKKALEIRYL
jgi:hypothetical protein